MNIRHPKGLVITDERYRENYFDNSNKGESSLRKHPFLLALGEDRGETDVFAG